MSNGSLSPRDERTVPSKRPWIVRARAKSWRTGEWRRWCTHGTYATEDRARAAALGFNGPNHQARFFHRDLLAEMKDYESREPDTRGVSEPTSPTAPAGGRR